MAKRRDDLEVAWRIAALEARVAALERKLKLAPAPVRGARVSRLPRCPGCLLEIPRKYLGPSCVWCGFALDAVPPLQPPITRRTALAAPAGRRRTR